MSIANKICGTSMNEVTNQFIECCLVKPNSRASGNAISKTGNSDGAECYKVYKKVLFESSDSTAYRCLKTAGEISENIVELPDYVAA
eukprot:6470912-Amphidinium_carterae.1